MFICQGGFKGIHTLDQNKDMKDFLPQVIGRGCPSLFMEDISEATGFREECHVVLANSVQDKGVRHLFTIYPPGLLLQCAQSCPTLCNPMDCSTPGSSVHGISQARILEQVAISFPRGSPWSRDWPLISCITGGFVTAEPPGKPQILELSSHKSGNARTTGRWKRHGKIPLGPSKGLLILWSRNLLCCIGPCLWNSLLVPLSHYPETAGLTDW